MSVRDDCLHLAASTMTPPRFTLQHLAQQFTQSAVVQSDNFFHVLTQCDAIWCVRDQNSTINKIRNNDNDHALINALLLLEHGVASDNQSQHRQSLCRTWSRHEQWRRIGQEIRGRSRRAALSHSNEAPQTFCTCVAHRRHSNISSGLTNCHGSWALLDRLTFGEVHPHPLSFACRRVS